MDYSGNTYFLMRHGEATHNVAGVLSTPEDGDGDYPELTDIGREQVKLAGEKLLDEKINVIYTSPYLRTMQTASIISGIIGVKIFTDKRLVERNFGVFNGRPIMQYYKYFKNNEERIAKKPEGGETLADVYGRVKNFLDEVNNLYSGKNILIISHGDVVWSLESLISGISIEDALENVRGYSEGEFRKFSLLEDK